MSALTEAYWTTVRAYARLKGVTDEEAERLLEVAAQELATVETPFPIGYTQGTPERREAG